uniref:SWI/SNF-related matrix-associated actin-dependent regulator of chromatin subfamily A-like protein 1 n=1 Tax=Plectus sambesii TaxID=2011161 RepID=A0A914VXK7_9BILA
MSESTSGSALTEEQRQRAAANRERAIQLRDARLKREAAEAAAAAAAQQTTAIRQAQPAIRPSFVPQRPTLSTHNGPRLEKPAVASIFQSKTGAEVEVSATLINCARFKVVFSIYRDALVDVCRSLNTKAYDPVTRTWNFLLSEYKKAEAAFKAIPTLNVTFCGLDETVKKIFNAEINGVETNSSVPTPDVSKIDPSLIDKVFAFQRAGIIFGVQKGGRVLVADEMGLGKSVQALGIARYYKAEWPLLIVCPSSVKFAWQTQIAKFLPSVSSEVMVVERSGDPLPSRRTSDTIVILSYEQMSIRLSELTKFDFRVVIFDESHMIKDSKAKRTTAALTLTKHAPRVLLLSGTPALSRPSELFNQLKAVCPTLFRNFKSFAVRYCDGRQGRFAFEANGATNMQELAAILEKTIMIRRLKMDVLDDLPEKRREMIVLEGDAIQNKMRDLQQAERSCLSAADTQERKKKLIAYFGETGMAKASTVAKHIVDQFFVEGSNERKDDRKVLIFAHHQFVLDTVATAVAGKGLKSIRIDGSTPSKRREELCHLFQTDANYCVALLSIMAAGVGITLTAASLVIFAELHWNPGTLVQAEDRAHRVGQKDSVLVQYIVARGTADDHIWPLIQRKLDVLTSVKLSSDSFKEADSRSIHTGSANQPTLDSFFGELVAEESVAEPDSKRARIDPSAP